ncbi:MAG TPA: hypothetical protein P5120_10505 [Spirochaetota bacterium]|nr:hypothetical protein [Spirochaetota bacterium]HPF04795.1 hypothetical protein [Spirochaetota bacterium]HPJ41088.1 hypothetical protein [Spirochaetota bacterium]HPR37984.1 hypothetical protein [Spirochaetota bacterium]HRX47937.1 hypothetical protein [Spirochaetota bacterium]
MKREILTVILAVVVVFISSCGKSGSEKFPAAGYVNLEEGALLQQKPEEKSGIISIVPFGSKLNLKEKSPASGDAAWYRTEWHGTDAWIKSSLVSDMKGFAEVLNKSVTKDQSFVKEENRKFFVLDKTDGIKRFAYNGGEMEPAEMTFLPGGGMILSSKIFSEKYSNYYFTYQFLNEGRLLKITFSDSRLNLDDYAEVENGSASVFKIDRNEGSITYHLKDGAFYFMNWGFVSRD